MSDRSDFWPATPDWKAARILAGSITITAGRLDTPTFILSGDESRLMRLATPYMKASAAKLLRMTRDRFLLISTSAAALEDGWHGGGIAVSAADGIFICIDIRGPDTMDLLSTASMSIAMTKAPYEPAVLAFAGVTLLLEPLDDGARLYVEHPQATYVWQWLQASFSRKDI